MGKLRLIASTALTHPGYQDGSTPSFLTDGWGIGDHAALETDASNLARMIVEPGETTQVWYFAPDSTDGYTQAEIAAAESVSAATITAAWIAGASNTAGWGKRSDLPLAWVVGGSSDIGRTLYFARYNRDNITPRSEWAMFMRGGSYNISLGAESSFGESALHPTLYGAFGEGSRPQFTVGFDRANRTNTNPHNLVFQSLDFRKENKWNTGIQYIIYADCNFSTDYHGCITGSGGRDAGRITHYGCSFIDCVKQTPLNGVTWDTDQADRHSAIYNENCDHILRWRCFFDRNAWSPTFNANGVTWNSGEFGMPPNQYNHDIYDQNAGVTDVTDLENVHTRAGFDAGQLRSGSFLNIGIRSESNFGDLLADGDQPDATSGNISYYNRVAIMGQARKVHTGAPVGAIGGGFISGISSNLSTSKNVIAANVIDPAHSEEETSLADSRFDKTAYESITLSAFLTDPASNLGNRWKYEDILINWGGNERNASGISAANRNACTIGRWADDKQGVAAGTNTTDDACDYIRTLEDRCLQAIPIWNYVAGLTGKGTIGHTAGAVATFSPDPDGDGWRTDTPDSWLINGVRGDFPVDGDDCDLNGNLAYSFMTWRFGDMDFGAGGGWRLYGGYISCTSMQETSEGSVELLGAAQFWIKGNSTADVVVTATGGRLGIDATVSNVRGAFSGKSELLIDAGGALTISTGDTITLTGGDVKAGADGQTGTASLTVNGTLAFVAADGAIASVREFRSGKYGLAVPTAGHTGQPLDPSVTFNVVLASGSEITVDTTGLTAGTYDLIDCDSLTDSGATLPAGVAVVGNKLVLTVS